MAELNVIFEVPEAIAEGLRNCTLEQAGGVIRRVGDKKQIAMWLQEGVLLERNTAEQLLKQGSEQTQLLRQQAEQLQMLGVQQQMMMGLQVANLAVSVAGFATSCRASRISSSTWMASSMAFSRGCTGWMPGR